MAGKLECFECGRLVTPTVIERTESLPVRGEPTEVLARVGQCPACGCDLSIEELDNETLVAAFDRYRQEHGLMTPDEMRQLRERYGASVRAFSLLLGWGEITLHRYESGSLQDAAHETALRLAEDPANVRVYLKTNGHKLTARQRRRIESHLDAVETGVRRAAECPGERFVVREERDAYGGWTTMQLSKLREMMIFFAQCRDMYTAKLNKLLFYADFSHYKNHSTSISGSPYLAFQHGPVPQHYPWIEADLLEGGDLSKEEIIFRNGGSGTVFKAERQPDLSVFNPHEVETLERVRKALAGQTSGKLRDRSHRERAWLDTPSGEMISYDHAQDLSF